MRLSILLTAAVLALAPGLGGTAAQAASLDTPVPAVTGTQVATADAIMLVSHGYAHLRKEPNTRSTILATLKKGTKLTVIGKSPNGKWAHVKTDKLEGYVAISLLKAA